VTTPLGLKTYGFWNDPPARPQACNASLRIFTLRIVVPVDDKATDRALVDAYRKGHLLDMTTTGTGLRCISRINFDHGATSLFRFVAQMLKRTPDQAASAILFASFGFFTRFPHYQSFNGIRPNRLIKTATCCRMKFWRRCLIRS